MGLNPDSYQKEGRAEWIRANFRKGESPYFAMFRAGLSGIPIEMLVHELTSIGVPIRSKDIESWQDGMFKHQMKGDPCFTVSRREAMSFPFDSAKLSDFPKFPEGWTGTERRFFPCNSENMPTQAWGWKRGCPPPQLYDRASAKALSPCGWVGQNMLYQRFVVMDIDGRGHGEDDEQVIAFGNLFKDNTLCMEDPHKPGSFHLYFSTDRIIPVKHFGWAKLDFMGNAVNAAVYMKNKVSNGLPMIGLDEDIWQTMLGYQRSRKEIL